MYAREDANMQGDILRGWQVLIVDDEPDSLEITTELISLYGAIVHQATNGREALAIAQQQTPDFIISDINMPIMDGWGLIAELKKDRVTLDIPVIALTAYGMDGDRNRAIAAGFHNHLAKPLDARNFVDDLLRLLLDVPELAERLEDYTP